MNTNVYWSLLLGLHYGNFISSAMVFCLQSAVVYERWDRGGKILLQKAPRVQSNRKINPACRVFLGAFEYKPQPMLWLPTIHFYNPNPTFMMSHEKNSMWWMLYCQTPGFALDSPCTHLIVKLEKGSLVIDWQLACPMGTGQGVKWPNCCVRLMLLFCQKYINWLSV